MIARAAAPSRVPSTPSLVGSKRPQLHRFHLTGGRVLQGNLHRAPTMRLADHLSNLKGFISVTDASCMATGDQFEYLVLNQDHVVFIEEIHDAPPVVG